MTSDADEAPKEISEVTRRAIFDHFGTANVNWAGRLEDDEFLARIYDLPSLPSFDHRYKDAADDIFHHCRFNDWARDWIFFDPRFNLMDAADSEFLRFLCETVHPVVRPASDEVSTLVRVYNEALTPDGYQVVPGKTISGRPIFVAQFARRAVVFEEPTGWQKVDRQLQEMRLRLDSAETEEQYQGVGLLPRGTDLRGAGGLRSRPASAHRRQDPERHRRQADAGGNFRSGAERLKQRRGPRSRQGGGPPGLGAPAQAVRRF